MIIKCKMCGGDITFSQGDTCGTCDYCGSTSTIPKSDDEQKLNRFNRANHFRRQGEFDKAIAAYEKILDEDDTDAEAHWGSVLSRYGIEYVEDPATKRRIPTCHRVQVESILTDADYQAALQYAPDARSRDLYEEQAKEIAEIQKGILAISASEKPYDVFICYKETDEDGKRTKDSALAQEVYYGLTEQGYKVFFSRITLEDKLGQEYEPYIFAALNSAKIMVAIGTKPEYFNAVWVKNEWSRYLHLMKNDRKRLLIPCYRDMDPYDLPEELSNLQSQDMSKIGFMQDLLRGIRKVLDAEKETIKPVQQPIVQQVAHDGNSNLNALLDRAFLALEDGEFDKADEFCEQALNLDAKNSRAYLGKLMAEYRIKTPDALAKTLIPLDKSNNYQKAVRFANQEQKEQLTGWNQTILDRNERNRKLKIRDDALSKLRKATTVRECELVRNELISIRDFEGVEGALESCNKKIQTIAVEEQARKEQEEKERLIAEQKAKEDDAKRKRITIIISSVAVVAIAVLLLVTKVIIPKGHYDKGIVLREAGKWQEAISEFELAGDYSDAATQIPATRYREGEVKREAQWWDGAVEAFKAAGSYSDAETQINETRYQEAEAKREAQDWDRAVAAFRALGSYRDAATQIFATRYREGEVKRDAQDWDGALEAFEAAGTYSDATEQIMGIRYQQAKKLYDDGDYASAYAIYKSISEYKDVITLLANDENLLMVRKAILESYRTPGSIVSFGRYEQDNDLTNGPEEIEWFVLDYDEKEHKALLLSKYCLDEKPYNTEKKDITWEKSTIREWLNSEFLQSAFSAEERDAILITDVDNSMSQGYKSWKLNGGNNTQDQVFLLSYAEANLYLNVTFDGEDNAKAHAYETVYAFAQNRSPDKYNSETAVGFWWLRSPGDKQQCEALVNSYGKLDFLYADYDDVSVRPALWINVESDIF